VIVEAMPDDEMASSKGKKSKKEVSHGLDLETLTDETAEALRVRTKTGVVVRQIRRGSPAALSGIERGDVIIKVNGHAIRSVKSFTKHAKVLDDGVALRVLIDRHGDQVFTVIYPPRK
jgi:serine protease Do